MATQEQIAQHSNDKVMLILSSLALVFGIVWLVVGDSNVKLIYVTLAFAAFLHALVTSEKSGIALSDAH